MRKQLFTPKWIIATLLVIIAVPVMVRLGIWQLDRLEQRRAFNARVQAQLDQPMLELDAQALQDNLLVESLSGMEYRSVEVQGEYDHQNQVVLRNQNWNGQLGVHIITPLRISGSDQSVLVNRGWAPMEDFSNGQLEQYDETGLVTVQGVIRGSQEKPTFGRISDPPLAPGQERLEAFYMANVARIADQTPYALLPIYIQQSPDPAWESLPYRSEPDLELTEGSHLGYAIQWFSFAAILGIGYPVYLRREMKADRYQMVGTPGADVSDRL